MKSATFFPSVLAVMAMSASPVIAFTETRSSSPSSQLGLFSRSGSGAVLTGPRGKPAKSFEEDLHLTLQLIMDHETRSVTTTKEQMISQVQKAAALDEEIAADDKEVASVADVSIPYNAAAKLAFESVQEEELSFEEFEPRYLAQSVIEVMEKNGKEPSAALLAAAEGKKFGKRAKIKAFLGM